MDYPVILLYKERWPSIRGEVGIVEGKDILMQRENKDTLLVKNPEQIPIQRRQTIQQILLTKN